MPRTRLFLERRSYRMRRVMDAVRLLPVLGLMLWMVPLMWPLPEDGTPTPMSTALLYLFGIWCALVAGALTLWITARRHQDVAQDDTAGS